MNQNKRVTDRETVLRHLKSGAGISAIEAIKKYGIMRLSARIFDLRDEYGEGQIVTVNKVSADGERFAEYRWNFSYTKSQLLLF